MEKCFNSRCGKDIENIYIGCPYCGFKLKPALDGTEEMREQFFEKQLEEFWAKEDAEREAKLRQVKLKVKLYSTKDTLTTTPIERELIFEGNQTQPIEVASFEEKVNIGVVIQNGLGDVKEEEFVFSYVPKSTVLLFGVIMDVDAGSIRGCASDKDGTMSLKSANEIKLF